VIVVDVGRSRPLCISPIHHCGHELMVQDRPRGCKLELGSSSYGEYQELLEDVADNRD
jgi:hypothetical protein